MTDSQARLFYEQLVKEKFKEQHGIVTQIVKEKESNERLLRRELARA